MSSPTTPHSWRQLRRFVLIVCGYCLFSAAVLVGSLLFYDSALPVIMRGVLR